MSGKDIYEYDVDLDSHSAPANVIRMVKAGSKVLEVGAGPGSITRILTNKLKCHVTAIEVEDASVAVLAQYCKKAIKADLNDHSWVKIFKREKFDFIIAADVLEHVYDPWETLKVMKTLLKKGGSVILSLPHVGHNGIQACINYGDFRYGEWGLLDRTHIRFFGMHNIQSLINDSGLKIVDTKFVVIAPVGCEFADIWMKTPKKLRKALSENKFGSVYQVVTRSVLETSSEQAVDLVSQPVPPPHLSLVNEEDNNLLKKGNFKTLWYKYASQELRYNLYQFAKKIGIRS